MFKRGNFGRLQILFECENQDSFTSKAHNILNIQVSQIKCNKRTNRGYVTKYKNTPVGFIFHLFQMILLLLQKYISGRCLNHVYMVYTKKLQLSIHVVEYMVEYTNCILFVYTCIVQCRYRSSHIHHDIDIIYKYYRYRYI